MRTPAGHISLRAISEVAGVSQSTVSRALKDDARISEPVRKHVQKTARDMGYVPDPALGKLLSHLRSMQSERQALALGFVYAPEPYPNRYMKELVRGAKARALSLGYSVDDFPTALDAGGIRKLNRVLRARGVQGIIVFPRLDLEPPPLDLDAKRFAIVSCASFSSEFPVHTVASSHFWNADLIWDYIAKTGFKRPGLITFQGFNRRQRWSGPMSYFRFYLERLKEVPPEIFDWSGTSQMIEQKFLSWFDQIAPDVLVVFSERAQDAIKQIFDSRGRSAVPMIGIGNTPPGYSGIDERPALLGSAAVDMLTAHILRNEKGWPEDVKQMTVRGVLRLERNENGQLSAPDKP